MDYVDYMLVRLADETQRATLFDQAALAQLALAAYDAEAMTLGPPYSAVFEQVFIGISIPRLSTAQLIWGPITGSDRCDGRATFYGLGHDGGVRVDALWRGAVVAAALSPMAGVERLLVTFSDMGGIDDEIRTALGTLPSGARLEAERRQRALVRLRTGLRQPEAFGDAQLDRWLADIGAASVGEVIERFANQLGNAAVQVQLSAAPTGAPAPRTLPLAAAILVRDRPLSIAQLLADSKLVRDRLDDLGVARAPVPDSAQRHPAVVVWMIPEVTFDDADWPGGESGTTDDERRRLRRLRAGLWLAREGIGLATTPAHT